LSIGAFVPFTPSNNPPRRIAPKEHLTGQGRKMAKSERKEETEMQAEAIAEEASKAENKVEAEEHGEIDIFEKVRRADLKAQEAAKKKAEPSEEESEEAKKEAKKAKKSKKSEKAKKAHKRSKKYQDIVSLVDKTHTYTLDEAVELVKKTSISKFGGSVDMHVKIAKIKAKKGPGETFRALVELPSGTGKSKNIVVLTEEIIEEIFKAKTAEADIYLAAPEIMPKVGKIARILGTQGKMPNPKSGTVTSDIDKTKEALEGGRIELRADASNVMHQSIGRLDWEDDKLKANYHAIIAVLPKSKIQSVTLAPTMGPGVKIAFKK